MGIVAIVGGIALGEYIQPYQSIQESTKFYNVPTMEKSPSDPWNYEVKRELVDVDGKTYQGIYLVNEVRGIHKKIDETGCTCSVENSIDELVGDVKEWVGEKVQATKDWFNAD